MSVMALLSENSRPRASAFRLWSTAAYLAMWVVAGSAHGQEVRLEPQVIGGGGGHGSSGSYALSGTLGQPAAGPSEAATVAVHAGFWTSGLSVVVEPGDSFEEWMDSLPTDQQPPPGERGPEDMPAMDGVSNLLKYALGIPPMTAAADAAPLVVMHDGYLGIEMERSVDAAAALGIEVSEDLSLWLEAAHVEHDLGPAPDGRERVRLLTGIRPEDAARYFLKLRVTAE